MNARKKNIISTIIFICTLYIVHWKTNCDMPDIILNFVSVFPSVSPTFDFTSFYTTTDMDSPLLRIFFSSDEDEWIQTKTTKMNSLDFSFFFPFYCNWQWPIEKWKISSFVNRVSTCFCSFVHCPLCILNSIQWIPYAKKGW